MFVKSNPSQCFRKYVNINNSRNGSVVTILKFLSPPYILDSQLKNLFFNTALKWTVLGFTSDSNNGFDSDLIWRESCRTWSCMLSVESVRFSCSLESVRLKLFDFTWGRTELGENEWSRLIRGSAPKVSSILFVMGFLKSFGVDIWTFLLETVDLPKPSTSIVSENFEWNSIHSHG